MRLFELFSKLNEAKANNVTTKKPVQRNWVAKNAKTSGAGPHQSPKFNRKEKHKGKTPDSE